MGGGPDSPGCWQSFPWQCQGLSAAPVAHFRVTGKLWLRPRKSFRQNGCHGSQKAVWKPKISDPNLSLPQHLPNRGQSSSSKEAKSLHNCTPTARVEKHTRHRELDGVQNLPFSAIKAWGGPSTIHLCIPSASGLCNSSVHLHPKCNKNRQEGQLVSCGLKKIQKGHIRNKSG